MKSSLQSLMISTTDKHNTPTHVIKLVQMVMGEIDLDPCADAGRSVPTKQHFTEVEDGLHREWHGCIYMNPPYGRTIGLWTRKLLREFDDGRVTEAILLVPARTDARWFQAVLKRGVPICLVSGRLRFSNAVSGAPFPNAVIYLGGREAAFAQTFSVLGPIVRTLQAQTLPGQLALLPQVREGSMPHALRTPQTCTLSKYASITLGSC